MEELQQNVVKVKKKSRKIPKCVRPEEFKALIDATPKDDLPARIGFLLAYASGMRISEVVRCSPEHFKPTSLFIPESKYGVERIVPIPKGWKPEFLKQLPLAITIRTLQRKFDRYAQIAKLPEIYTFHSLRHGFATRLLESGVPINQVQTLLGHSNIATTSIYTKANPIDAIKSYEDLF
jgi:integrase